MILINRKRLTFKFKTPIEHSFEYDTWNEDANSHRKFVYKLALMKRMVTENRRSTVHISYYDKHGQKYTLNYTLKQATEFVQRHGNR